MTSSSGRLADVGDVGWYGLPVRKVLALLKDCVSVMSFNGGDQVLWGKVHKPLQSVQTNHG